VGVGEGGLVEVEVASQILNTLVREEVVVVSPVEFLAQVTPKEKL